MEKKESLVKVRNIGKRDIMFGIDGFLRKGKTVDLTAEEFAALKKLHGDIIVSEADEEKARAEKEAAEKEVSNLKKEVEKLKKENSDLKKESKKAKK